MKEIKNQFVEKINIDIIMNKNKEKPTPNPSEEGNAAQHLIYVQLFYFIFTFSNYKS
jgi:hypothetical protein